MEQATTQLKNLTPYERTRVLQEFLYEYPGQCRIYCCVGCHALAAESEGVITPRGIYPCDVCQTVYCESCGPDMEEEEGTCKACRK